MLGSPPILLDVELADRNSSGTGCDSKFGFIGRPPHKSRRPVQPEQDQGRCPDIRSTQSPHISISILRARYDTVRVRRPSQRSDEFIVTQQGVGQLPIRAGPGVDLNFLSIGADRELLAETSDASKGASRRPYGPQRR